MVNFWKRISLAATITALSWDPWCLPKTFDALRTKGLLSLSAASTVAQKLPCHRRLGDFSSNISKSASSSRWRIWSLNAILFDDVSTFYRCDALFKALLPFRSLAFALSLHLSIKLILKFHGCLISLIGNLAFQVEKVIHRKPIFSFKNQTTLANHQQIQ